jgi:hypothetical protein
VLGVLPRSLLGEATVGMAVLLVAAILVDSKPPAPPAPAPTQARLSGSEPLSLGNGVNVRP